MAQYNPNIDEFEVQRKKAAQQVGAATQNQKDAIQRRFAAQGSLNSGAAIKQNQLIDEAGQEKLAQANEAINTGQNVELRRQKEVTEGRDFAKSEREAGQGFAASQAELNRKYGTSEREAAQGFQAGLANNAQAFAAQQGKLSRDLQSSQFDKQFGLAGLQFEEEKRINSANLDLQQRLANQRDMLEQLFGNFSAGNLGNLGSPNSYFGGAVRGGLIGSAFGGGGGGSLGAGAGAFGF